LLIALPDRCPEVFSISIPRALARQLKGLLASKRGRSNTGISCIASMRRPVRSIAQPVPTYHQPRVTGARAEREVNIRANIATLEAVIPRGAEGGLS